MAAGRARGSRPRRVSLPGVAELLRPVGPGPASDSGRQASGREAHSQKITVYLSADEFLDLERARLALLARGIGLDRGRLVREAIALLIMDLETGIDASTVARRLRAASQSGSASGAAGGGAAGGGVVSGRLVNGGAAGGGLANGAAAGGGPANGVPAIGGSANGGSASGLPAGGGAVSGALLNRALVNGVPGGGGPVGGAAAGPQ